MCKIVSKLGFEMAPSNRKPHRLETQRWKNHNNSIHPGKKLPRGLIRKILNDIDLPTEKYIKMR